MKNYLFYSLIWFGLVVLATGTASQNIGVVRAIGLALDVAIGAALKYMYYRTPELCTYNGWKLIGFYFFNP